MYLLNVCKQYTSKTCIQKNAVHTIFILITTLKRIHCCKSRFHLRDKGPLNNIPSSTFSPKKQQRCNLDRYLICLRLISSGRVIVCVRYGTNYAQKTASGGKKQHDFVAGNVPNRTRSSQKKKSKIHEDCLLNSGAPSRRRVTHAVTHLSSDGRNLAIFLAQITFLFFSSSSFHICLWVMCLSLYD